MSGEGSPAITEAVVRTLAAKLKGLHALLTPAEQTLLCLVLQRAAGRADDVEAPPAPPDAAGQTWAVSSNPFTYLDAIVGAPPTPAPEAPRVRPVRAAHGNQTCGSGGAIPRAVLIRFGSSNNTIAANLIANSGSDGLVIRAGNDNIVRGNYIGTNVTGPAVKRNDGAGVLLEGRDFETVRNVIGGGMRDEGNVISGNRDGIAIDGKLAGRTLVQNNAIGLKANGTEGLPNWRHGVWIVNSSAYTLGGTDPGLGNTIAFNGRTGVRVQSLFDDPTTGNAILGNAIYANGALCIDLGTDSGITKNDPLDEDTGANILQNFPELTA
jgi:hypothetical protein